MAEESKFWRQEILGIFPLSNPVVGQFASAQFNNDAKAFSDPTLISNLLKNAGGVKYVELKPDDISLMMLSPQNCGLIGNKKGLARVFIDPAHPMDPSHSIVLYYSSGAPRKDGKIPLTLENAIIGEQANVVMVYKKPCCQEMSVLVDAKTPKGRVFDIKDGQKGTHDAEKGAFYRKDATGKIELVGGKPLPLVQRVPSMEELASIAQMGNREVMAGALKIGRELGHRFLHAMGDKSHKCGADFKPQGITPK